MPRGNLTPGGSSQVNPPLLLRSGLVCPALANVTVFRDVSSAAIRNATKCPRLEWENIDLLSLVRIRAGDVERSTSPAIAPIVKTADIAACIPFPETSKTEMPNTPPFVPSGA